MKYNAEIQYLSIMRDILDNGEEVIDRTGTGTKKLFGKTIIHDFSNGFPLLTTKKMHIKSIVGELIWFLQGTENAQFLIDNKITIWDEWMKEERVWEKAAEFMDSAGNTQVHNYLKIKKVLPHTYGVKWRNFNGKDQIADVIESIKKSPHSRRHIVSAWDPANIENAALPWCHVMFQFNCSTDGFLDISVYQRSADWFLGVPFNLASYGFLLHMVAQQTGRRARRMVYNFGDSHVYADHVAACETQLQRNPYDLPTLSLTQRNSIDDYKIEDFSILNYKCHDAIKAKVSV